MSSVITYPETAGEKDDTLARLSRRFKAADVEKRDGFHYLKIDSVINRFNEVCGLSYSLELEDVTVTILEGETTRSGKQQYRVDAFGHLTVATPFHTAVRAGSGSAVNFDVDNAIKTAQAEVMKKAGHQFGVGLYLWKESERKLVDSVQVAEASGNLADFKTAVQALATIEGVSLLSAETIAEHFSITPDDLQEVSTLRSILASGGLV